MQDPDNSAQYQERLTIFKKAYDDIVSTGTGHNFDSEFFIEQLKDEAEKMQKKLEEAGAKVELK